MSLGSAKAQKEMSSIRDTVQSIWIAIVMAFVLRAFVVEAFVIPTGSMAAGLNGEHYDLVCPSCGYRYAFGWSPGRSSTVRADRDRPAGAECPNCHFAYVNTADVERRMAWINGGDRVLVLKYLYPLREPEPFDVVVFRNPQNNSENYIKRLIGLPGEAIELVHGDVYVTRATELDDPSVWEIRRKPRHAQQRMWHVVYDGDYPPGEQWAQDTDGRKKVPRWEAQGRDADHWKAKASGRELSFSGTSPARISLVAQREYFTPQYAYNDPGSTSQGGLYDGADVCDDLRVSLVLVPQDPQASLGVEIHGVLWQFRAVVAGGTVTLLRAPRDKGPWQQWGDVAKVGAMKIGRGYHVELVHSDGRVEVLLDGEVVIRQEYPGEYVRLKERLSQFLAGRDDPAVLFPDPKVAVTGADGPFDVRHLRVDRDIYYSSRELPIDFRLPDMEYYRALVALADKQGKPVGGVMPNETGDRGWGVTNRPIRLNHDPDNPDLDSFFVLGDNSPASLDGRMWSRAASSLRLWKDPKTKTEPLYQLGTVPRYNMIGKAVFVYWPAGYRLPLLTQLPIVPNVGKMRLVR